MTNNTSQEVLKQIASQQDHIFNLDMAARHARNYLKLVEDGLSEKSAALLLGRECHRLNVEPEEVSKHILQTRINGK